MHVRASKIRYQGTRADQQDSVNLVNVPPMSGAPARLVAVLADGIGGLSRGADASSVVNGAVSSSLVDALKCGPMTPQETFNAMDVALAEANDSLSDFKNRHNINACGSTLVCVVVEEGTAYFLSVGDSLLFGISATHGMKPINKKHTHEQDGKSYLASAVLGEKIANVDRGSINILDEKYIGILLSSDGLSTLPIPKVTDLLTGKSMKKLAEIVTLAKMLGREKQDNLSMVMVEFL